MSFTMKPVSSSNMLSAGYDPDAKKLRIEFANGSYDYEGVSASTFKNFMKAKSKGGFFAQSIKPNYDYEKVDD